MSKPDKKPIKKTKKVVVTFVTEYDDGSITEVITTTNSTCSDPLDEDC